MYPPDLSYLRRYLDISRAFLFGSAVSCDTAPDVDLLIISDSFRGMSLMKRREITKRCIDVQNIDPICLTTHEFEQVIASPGEFMQTVIPSLVEIT
jgi:hypothetical protein